jgi:hypothetical protein
VTRSNAGTLAVMNTPSVLLERLDALAQSLTRRDDAIALLALGSVGVERERLDAWSDLDFFVIVRDTAAKARYIAELSWLAEAHALAWHFQNTVDGHKVLMSDGVYAEFAVFERTELPRIAYAPGRFVWCRSDADGSAIDASLAVPRRALPAPAEEGWLVGEALSNLLVGLMRLARGERLAAMRLVQGAALDRVLELRERRGAVAPTVRRDPFAIDRRVEQRQPDAAALLDAAAPGIAGTPDAALALLAELRRLVEVPRPVAARIEALVEATRKAQR